jgi:uncharacterized membrane protein YGL010W
VLKLKKKKFWRQRVKHAATLGLRNQAGFDAIILVWFIGHTNFESGPALPKNLASSLIFSSSGLTHPYSYVKSCKKHFLLMR